MKVKLAIVGSRGFQDYDALSEFIDKTIKENSYEIIEVIIKTSFAQMKR